MNNNIFRDAFIYSSKPLNLKGFESLSLEEGYLYIVEPQKYLSKTNASGKSTVVLIGEKFNVTDSALELENIHGKEDASKAMYEWTGRYVLYAYGNFYNDACGLYHIYYGLVDGHPVITSSLALLKQEFEVWQAKDVDHLKLDHPLNWIPAPSTRYEGVHLLLPFQSVDIHLKIASRHIFPQWANEGDFAEDELLDRFIQAGRHIVSALYKDERPLRLALTGGHDSRTLFAFFKEQAENLSLVLFDHPQIGLWDILAFKKLAKRYAVKKKYLRRYPWKKSADRLIAFDRHCDQTCFEEDRLFFAFGQLNTNEPTLMLRANVVSEIFRIKNYYKFATPVRSFHDLLAELKKKYGKLDSFKTKALQQWYETRMVQDNCNNSIDWRLLFWLDQRSCAWAGSIDGATAISGYSYINPFNSQYLMNLIYRMRSSKQMEYDFQELIIKKLDASLLQMAFNKKDSEIIFNKSARKLLRLFLRMTA